MDELIDISVAKDTKGAMIKFASQAINRALSGILPPLNIEKDVVRLKKYAREAREIKLTYEVLRGVRTSKKEQNRSPYREINTPG